jgi:hypothetical protein
MSQIQHEYMNHPKMRWAQQIADLTQTDQAIIKNIIGELDIKRASAVELINNPRLVCVVEPSSRRRSEEIIGKSYEIISNYIFNSNSINFYGVTLTKPYSFSSRDKIWHSKKWN